jgi:hypothetical protein
MIETQSQSKWVGKVLNCKTCNKSFIVQTGDIIHEDIYKTARFNVLRGRYFELPCGHRWDIPPHMDKENH